MQKGLVSVITRTKNRLLFLKRAAGSLGSQTYKNIEWIIVNDGGDLNALKTFLADHPSLERSCKVVDNKEQLGRAGAANCGIAASSGEYVILHDDDDTWDKKFLETTTAFLNSQSHYLAVNTHAVEVTERIENEALVEVGRKPAPFNTDSITFVKMLTFNPVSTIGCLFRRDVFDSLSGFDPELEILEDYDFFLRLLCAGDIGNIQQPLANYHIRYEKHADSALDNTVTVGRNWHTEMLARYRNYHLRTDLDNGKFGLGSLLALGEINETIYLSAKSASEHIELIKKYTGYSFIRDKFILKK